MLKKETLPRGSRVSDFLGLFARQSATWEVFLSGCSSARFFPFCSFSVAFQVAAVFWVGLCNVVGCPFNMLGCIFNMAGCPFNIGGCPFNMTGCGYKGNFAARNVEGLKRPLACLALAACIGGSRFF